MRAFTLIDVTNGMFDLSLHTILTPPCFAFFWGLIQTANRLKPRFKNPFNMTIAQAQAAGGGNSRQAIWDKQQRLNEIMIDRRKLITITAGSKKDNLAAKYKINYKLLILEKPVIIDPAELPSNIIDELLTKSGRSADDLLTFLRSDQKRSEKTTTEAAVVSLSADKSKLSETDSLAKLMMDKFKLPTPPPNGDVNQMIYRYGLSCCVDALENSEPDSKTWRGILAYIDKVAKNISAKSYGVTSEKLDEWERDLRDLEYDIDELKEAGTYDDPRNKQYLIHTLPKMDNLRALIIQHGGKG